jgi:hypothetical protein
MDVAACRSWHPYSIHVLVQQKSKGKFTRKKEKMEEQQQNKSAIADHMIMENHVIRWEETRIVGRESDGQAECIREAIETRKVQGHAITSV